MLCYQHEDKGQVQHASVQLGTDNSPSSLMDHMHIHHLQEYHAVVVANNKKLSITTRSRQTALIRGSPVDTQRGRYYALHLILT